MRKNKSLRLIGLILGIIMIICCLNVFNPIMIFATEENVCFEDEFLNEKASKSTGQVKSSIFANKSISNAKYICNLDDSADYIYVEFENGGYVVFARETMEMMEYSLEGELPYSSLATRGYYAGPLNYFQKKDTKFVNLVTDEEFNMTDEETTTFSQRVRAAIKSQKIYHIESSSYDNIMNEVKIFIDTNENTNEINDEGVPSLDTDNFIYPTEGTGVLIPNYRYFIVDPTHGDNYDGETYGNGNSGTCGSVAAQILLGYNNYYNDRRIIEDRYLNGYNDSTNTVVNLQANPNHCTDPMMMTSDTLGTRSEGTGENSFYYKVITSIMEPNTEGATIHQVRNGIEIILNENLPASGYTINHVLRTGSSTVNSALIKTEINAGRPVIISLSKSLGAINHQVVGYGYQYYTYPTGGTTYEGYIVHFGWSGKMCVWVNSSWCKGYISLNINHDHTYNTVGTITGTNRTEYKCSTCGHRTDAAINMAANDRYVERIATIPQNGYTYKDYYVTFSTSGNKLLQTFGSKDTAIELFDDEYTLLASDDDSGYLSNALINYSATANKPYIVRVRYYNASTTGDTKLSVSPIAYDSDQYSDYDDIINYSNSGITHMYAATKNTVEIITFSPEAHDTYDLATGYYGTTRVDTCVYLIDPNSTSTYYFNDDGGGNLQALLSVELYAARPYYIIISAYNITTITDEVLYLDIDPA